MLKVWHTAWFSFLWTTYSWQLQDIYRQLYLLNIFSHFSSYLHLIFIFILVANSRLVSFQLNWKFAFFPIPRGLTKQNIKFSCMSILHTLRVMCSFFWWSKGGGESNRRKKWNLPNSFSTANLSNNLSTHENATQSCDAKGNIVFFPKMEKMIKSIERFMLLKIILN